MTAEHLVSFLGALVVGVATAIVSVQLALRRFRSERWWGRKTEAYATLFAALSDVQRSLSHEDRRMETGLEVSEQYNKELNEHARAGYLEIRRASVLGTFLFNKNTAARPETLINHLDEPGHNLDLYEEVSADLDAVMGCLHDLKSLAKRDLAIK